MYGKAFEQTFTGSMVGSGPVAFSVWFYVVANTDKDHYVELNPYILSAVIGADKADIQKAIDGFCSPDPDSRCSDHEGRKLIKEGQYLYFVTGHERFRNTRNGDDRREYMRNYMAERRKVLPVNKVNCKPQLAHTEAEADTKAEAIYKEYPRKVGKADALRAIRRALAKLDFPTLLEKTRQYAAARKGQDPYFTPHPATWFNRQSYNDDPAEWARQEQRPSKPSDKSRVV